MEAQANSSSVDFPCGIKKPELLEEFCLVFLLDSDSSIFDSDPDFAVFNLFSNESANDGN